MPGREWIARAAARFLKDRLEDPRSRKVARRLLSRAGGEGDTGSSAAGGSLVSALDREEREPSCASGSRRLLRPQTKTLISALPSGGRSPSMTAA